MWYITFEDIPLNVTNWFLWVRLQRLMKFFTESLVSEMTIVVFVWENYLDNLDIWIYMSWYNKCHIIPQGDIVIHQTVGGGGDEDVARHFTIQCISRLHGHCKICTNTILKNYSPYLWSTCSIHTCHDNYSV